VTKKLKEKADPAGIGQRYCIQNFKLREIIIKN
jgi:hypothetical protein